MEAWHDFWLAQVGGSAALAGLLFVSISINLKQVLTERYLAERAAIPLFLLFGILVNSSLLLVPGQSLPLIGIEIIVIGVALWGTVTYLDIKRLRETKKIYWSAEPARLLLTQVAALPYVIMGVVLWSGSEGGLYWMVPAVIASLIKSFTDAWVLLVEINR